MSKSISKEDPDYEEKRRKNNEAIRKSREKQKQKQKETQAQVDALKQENQQYEGQIKELEGQMEMLKGIFKAHAMRGAAAAGQPAKQEPKTEETASHSAGQPGFQTDMNGFTAAAAAPGSSNSFFANTDVNSIDDLMTFDPNQPSTDFEDLLK